MKSLWNWKDEWIEWNKMKHWDELDIDEAIKLTFALLESDSSFIGIFDTKHSLKVTEAIVDGCHINATRHDHENLRLIWFIQDRAFNIPGSQWKNEGLESYEELKG